MDNFLFNRQPVYDRNLKVVGYELVTEKFSGEDPARRKSVEGQKVLNGFNMADLNTLAANGQLFLDTPPLAQGNVDWALPPEKSVFQFQLSASEDRMGLLEDLQSSRDRKHKIALTGFSGCEEPELIKMADVLKMDVTNSALSDLEMNVDHMRQYKGKLLAHKVETQKRYQVCHGLGFDYFQGFFYCEPVKASRGALSASQVSLMKLLARIQDPDVELKDLEKIISRDAALCFRLLRYLNNACLGLVEKVDSISRAVNYLGLEPLKIWASVLLLARIEGKPTELMKTSLTRGRMCQALAELEGDENASAFFMTGLLSLMSAYMDRPMEDIVTELPLADEVANGLVAGEGKIGTVLQNTVDYERGEWQKLEESNFGKLAMRSSYLDAINFTEESFKRLN